VDALPRDLANADDAVDPVAEDEPTLDLGGGRRVQRDRQHV